MSAPRSKSPEVPEDRLGKGAATQAETGAEDFSGSQEETFVAAGEVGPAVWTGLSPLLCYQFQCRVW